MKRVVVAASVLACGVGLAACSSGSSSSGASSSPASQSLAMVCANADSTIVNDVPTTPTKESIQKTVADLNTINASATAEGKAALEPLIAAFTSIENVNFSASTPPPEYQAFITASQKFKSTCENAGVSFTAKPSSSPS